MAIKKYASTKNYGFGFPWCRYTISDTKKRAVNISNTASISIDGEVHDNIFLGKNYITLPPAKDAIWAHDRLIPLYMVLESGVWKEYFTGTPLKWYVWKDPRKFSSTVYTGSFKIDSNNPNAIKKLTNNVGIREFVVFHDDSDNYKEFTAQEFAKEISQYSKEEVESIVKQFYELQEMAKQWGPKFEKEAEQKVKELVRKKISTLSTLEHNVGAYARVESNTVPTTEFKVIDTGEEKNSQFQEDWGRYKKILVVLIILVITLSIMYILK